MRRPLPPLVRRLVLPVPLLGLLVLVLLISSDLPSPPPTAAVGTSPRSQDVAPHPSQDHPEASVQHARRVGRECPDDLVSQGALARCPGVLVIGVAGLRWDDLGPTTPALARLARTGAVGALSVKALPALTCPADGWLTLGAGTRAQAFGAERAPCGPSLAPDAADAPRNADSRDGGLLGALATALEGRVEASGRGAALAVDRPGAGPDHPGPDHPGPDHPGPDQPGPDQPLVLVDAGTLDGADRDAALRRADAAVERALSARPPDVDLLVVGLSESVGGDEAHLHVAIATGPSFPRGALRSASTRRAPYVQLIDVAPTVLDLLDTPVPAVMDGQAWQVWGPAPSIAELVDLDRKAQGQRAATVPFFVVLYAATLGLLLLAGWRRWARVAEVVALTGTAALGASYLANLFPWWRADLPLLALLAVVVPIAAAVAMLALTAAPIFASWGPSQRDGSRQDEDQRATTDAGAAARPAALVCGFVATVLLGDLVTGAHLQIGSVAGYSALVAGRFAGIGNVAFGVLAAAVLLAMAALTRRAAVVAVVAVVTVVVDGAPPWGSDVGGVLALVPAFALLAMLRSGTRVSLLRLALAGGAGAVVVSAFALADWARQPADRTHLGRFAQDVRDGTAGELLGRKADAVFGLVLSSPVTAMLPVLVAAVVYVVVRPPGPLRHAFEVATGWRHGLLAVGLASLVGFALNDSGAAVVALAAAVALPATAAVITRARRCSAAAPPL